MKTKKYGVQKGFPRDGIFGANVLVQGMILGILQTVLFTYLASLDLHAWTMGVSIMFSCIVESIFFYKMDTIWCMFGSSQRCFRLALVFDAVYLMLYSFLRVGEDGNKFGLEAAVVLVQMLFGSIYALFWASALAIANELATNGLHTTAQGALAALYTGIGPALGASIAGFVYARIGAPWLFRMCACTQIAVLVLPFALKANPPKKSVEHRRAVLQNAQLYKVGECRPLLDTMGYET